jgi:hypothetical protein
VLSSRYVWAVMREALGWDKSARVLIFNIIAFLQQWMVLVPAEERELAGVSMAIEQINKAMKIEGVRGG